jgi:hypothetical protein
MALGSTGPVEAKVSAATAGAALSAIVCWALDTYVLPTAMPPVIGGAVTVLVVGGTTFASGFMAKHTARTDVDTGAERGRHERPD